MESINLLSEGGHFTDAFYFISFNSGRNRRAKISAWIVTAMIFGVDAFVLWFGRFIPLYCAALNDFENKEEDHDESTD